MPTHSIAALELGGTKTVAALGGPGGMVSEEIRFPTTTPEETLGKAVTWYLDAILCLAAVVCPSIVVLGGGVPQAEGLHARVTEKLRVLSNGYFGSVESPGHVVPPGLGQQAGIAGAMLVAQAAKRPPAEIHRGPG